MNNIFKQNLKRRSLLAASGASLVAAVLAACSADGGSVDGPLKVGIEGTYRPYGFHDENGKLVGFEVEIATAIAKGLGREIQWVETKWDSLLAGLDNGQYDFVINNVSITEERKEVFDFSTPYAKAVGRVAVPSDSEITSVSQIPGKTAAQSATSNWGKLMEESGATLVPVQGFAEAIELIQTGRADLTANDVVAFETYLAEHPEADFKLLEEDLATEILVGIAFKKGNELLGQVNEQLEKLKSDGTLTEIYTRWVGVDLSA